MDAQEGASVQGGGQGYRGQNKDAEKGQRRGNMKKRMKKNEDMREGTAPVEQTTGGKGRNIINYKIKKEKAGERTKRQIEERKKRIQKRGQGHKRVVTKDTGEGKKRLESQVRNKGTTE